MLCLFSVFRALPIWFDQQEVTLATYYHNREYEELKFWIKLMRHNFVEKLVKANLNLPVGLNVSKRLVVENGLDVTVVMKSSGQRTEVGSRRGGLLCTMWKGDTW